MCPCAAVLKMKIDKKNIFDLSLHTIGDVRDDWDANHT